MQCTSRVASIIFPYFCSVDSCLIQTYIFFNKIIYDKLRQNKCLKRFIYNINRTVHFPSLTINGKIIFDLIKYNFYTYFPIISETIGRPPTCFPDDVYFCKYYYYNTSYLLLF